MRPRWLRPALGAAVLAALLVVSTAGGQTVGSVAALEGSAEVERAGARVPLAAGDAVQLGDRIRTPAGGRVRMVLVDESVLTVAPESEMTLDAETVGPVSTTQISTWSGAVRAVVTDRYKTPGSRFEAQTPTAVAGVRGTGFIVFYEPSGRRTRVLGLYDTTRVRARNDPGGRHEVVVGPGQLTEVSGDKPPTVPRPLGAKQMQDLTASTEMTTGGLEPEAELAPGRREGAARTASGVAAGSQLPGDPATPTRPGADAFRPDDHVVDQPLDHFRRTGPPIPPIPPVRTR